MQYKRRRTPHVGSQVNIKNKKATTKNSRKTNTVGTTGIYAYGDCVRLSNIPNSIGMSLSGNH